TERLGQAIDEQVGVRDRVRVHGDPDVETVAIRKGTDVRVAAEPRSEGEALLDERSADVSVSAEARHRGRDEVDGARLRVERGSQHTGGQPTHDRRDAARDA